MLQSLARLVKFLGSLENFIEKGYPFVLDADVTSGEQSDGTYKVFVEIERNKDEVEKVMNQNKK